MAASRPDTWMPIYWGDYAKDTGHLSAAHHGAYLMLIKHYWVTGKPLPIDDAQLWRIACADSLGHWRKLKPVVLAFFEQRDGALHHGRVEKELTSAGEHAERRAEMARKASRARWGGDGGGNSGGTPGGNAPRNAQGNTDSNAPRMPDAMPGHSPPPSPSPDVTTALPVSHSVSESRFEPIGASGDDGLEIPKYLKRAPHAQVIGADWLPSEQAQADLVKSRPDLTPERIVERTEEFRLWCAETNKTSHNPDATWLGFMRRTHEQRSRSARPVQRGGESPTADGISAAFARRSILAGG